MLFPAGKKPHRAAVRELAETIPNLSVTLDPFEKPPLDVTAVDTKASGKGVWLELLREGLSFDLEGLGPGEGCQLPRIEYRFDFPADASIADLEAIRLGPGGHLNGSERSIPILRGMIAVARDLADAFPDLAAVAWPPARSLIGSRFFESTMAAWLVGGPFPALGLTSFRETMDGGLETMGLAHLIGQELRIEPVVASDRVAATRLGVRLVNHLVMAGRLENAEELTGPDGRRIVLRPSKNGKFIRVWGD